MVIIIIIHHHQTENHYWMMMMMMIALLTMATMYVCLLCGCCCLSFRSRVGGIELEDLKEILQDLWALGWPEDQMSYLRKQISSYHGAYSEAWKESFPGRMRWEEEEVQDSVTDRIWKRHGWNRFDSGFGYFRAGDELHHRR